MIKTFEKAVTKSKIIPGVKLKISANDHFIVTDNGRRILVDTGCPYDINEKSMQRIPGLRRHLEGGMRAPQYAHRRILGDGVP